MAGSDEGKSAWGSTIFICTLLLGLAFSFFSLCERIPSGFPELQFHRTGILIVAIGCQAEPTAYKL
jgi:hypothetical protein